MELHRRYAWAIVACTFLIGCEGRKPMADKETTYEERTETEVIETEPEKEGASVDIDVGNGKGVNVDIEAGEKNP